MIQFSGGEVVLLHPEDNTAVTARAVAAGAQLQAGGRKFTPTEAIKIGHKIAIEPIAQGQPVRKYGQVIGFAMRDIPAGGWVHSHNLGLADFQRDYAISQFIPPPPEAIVGRTFQGFRRADGRVGTRNYLAVISTVNCSSTVSKYMAERASATLLKQYPNIDGIISIKHPSGCGMEYKGLQHQILNRVLGGMAKHPNIGGYLLVGLGCEQGAMGHLIQEERLVQISGSDSSYYKATPGVTSASGNRGPLTLSMQDQGGTRKTVERGLEMLAQMLPRVNDVRRESVPLSEILLGTNCGGSDGNSGVTCNPALGYASDLLVAAGATSALAETSEIYGAEHLLTRRARTPEVAEKLLERIRWWKWYANIFGGELDNNPSVGNKEGGLTTIVEKSLGAVAKAGSTTLEEVYQYAEQMTAKGMVVMDTPGFDPPSVTGLIAGGANVVVFTTGRGSCYACKPVPTIKVASNTPMYERMIDDMDINAGGILEGRPVEEVGREIFDEIVAVCGGKKTKSELEGIGDEEFVPWIIGPVL